LKAEMLFKHSSHLTFNTTSLGELSKVVVLLSSGPESSWTTWSWMWCYNTHPKRRQIFTNWDLRASALCTQRRVVIPDRRFGKTIGPIFKIQGIILDPWSWHREVVPKRL